MASVSRVALSFFPARQSDFEYTIYRRRLADEDESVPGTRHLPENCTGDAKSSERHRYEVSLEQKPGFEAIRIAAWIDPALTDEVLYTALVSRVRREDLRSETELSDRQFVREVGFVLARHGSAREIMWLRAYGLRILGRFGLLCHFALRVPNDSSMTDKRRLELSLTHKNGRINEDYYLDQNQKIEFFVRRYFGRIATLSLHDGTIVDFEPKLAAIPSFTLDRRTYVFRDGHEGRNQFFGLRDNGPFAPVDTKSRIVFMFSHEDHEQSQHLYRALRGDVYSTFPGMASMFGAELSRSNVSGIEVAGFTNAELQTACKSAKAQFPNDRLVPVVLVPLTKHTSDEETARYFAAKHAFISLGLASQFVDRKQTQDRNALKWSVSNIGLALFAKMGGQPWRVKPSTSRCLVVGVGQAHRIANRKVERYVAYTVLTDSTGGFETIKVLSNSQSETAYLSDLRANLRQVLLSHSQQYDSFVLHVTFNVRRREIDAIRQTLADLKSTEGIDREFIAIKFNDKNDYLGFSIEHNSRVPHEGTVVPLSKREYLMWFSGLSPDDSKVPRKPERPAHVSILYPEVLSENDLRRVLQDAMNIAGGNWRGFNAKSMPISVYYAKIIADYYGHFREGGLSDVDFDTVSPWFL